MLKKAIFIIPVLLLLQSCNLTDDSQYDVEEGVEFLEAKDLLTTVLNQVGYNRSAVSGRSASLLMHQLQWGDTCGPIGLNDPRENTENMWTNGYYLGSLKDINEMLKLSEIESANEIKSIALILLAHEYEQLTCMFGDIPFNEALRGEEILKPKYDSQADVYAGIIALLDEAVTLIGNKSSFDDLSGSDIIYRGEMQSWKKFAYGLKARFLFNQRNKEQGNDQEILTLIDKSFSHRDEQATAKHDLIFENPQFLFGDQRPSTINISEYLIDELLDTDDPRIPELMEYDDSSGEWTHFNKDGFICHWFSEYARIPILSYTELLFMKTELAVQLNSQDDSQLLAKAITSSMRDNNVQLDNPTLAYIDSYSDLVGLDLNTKMKKIADQTFIAYFGNNHMQSWNNFRRTGYPELVGITAPVTSYNPTGSILRRFMYPISEYEYNLSNVEEAKARQESILLDSDVWMFKN